MNPLSRRTLLGAGALAAGSLLPGCGLGTAGGFNPSARLAGPVAGVGGLHRARFKVGSKSFTEAVLLSKITVIMLQSAGATVLDYTRIPGSAGARQAHREGQIDMQWEYTGTGWISYLGHTDPIPDAQRQFEAVAREDLQKNGLRWLRPAPMNNTYGFAIRRDKAGQLGVERLSDLAKVAKEQRTFCVEAEFASRNDGFQPLLKTYGLSLGGDVDPQAVKTLDTGAIYAATGRGVCNFGEVFTTDGRIKALDLVVLKDDKQFFPLYNACLVVRETLMQQYPQLEQLFAPVTAKLTDEVLIDLNAKVDVEGREPSEVAFEWLLGTGLLIE